MRAKGRLYDCEYQVACSQVLDQGRVRPVRSHEVKERAALNERARAGLYGCRHYYLHFFCAVWSLQLAIP